MSTMCFAVSVLSLFVLLGLGGFSLADQGHDHGAKKETPQFAVPPGNAVNGEAIYLRGTTSDGERILFRLGPYWLEMHCSSCTSCRGTDGAGGFVPHICAVKSPGVTWKALRGEVVHGHEGSDDHAHVHVAYTFEALRLTLETGVAPAGQTLDGCMPRWFLDEGPYADLANYLGVLDGD